MIASLEASGAMLEGRKTSDEADEASPPEAAFPRPPLLPRFGLRRPLEASRFPCGGGATSMVKFSPEMLLEGDKMAVIGIFEFWCVCVVNRKGRLKYAACRTVFKQRNRVRSL